MLPAIEVGPGRPLMPFVAPPWGDALGEEAGLDLRRTAPQVAEIVDRVCGAFPDAPMLFAIQLYERLTPGSLEELLPRFDWEQRVVYDLNEPGKNHGILLATRGWTQ